MNKEQECLQRLFKLTTCYAEIVDFLFEEKLIDEATITALKAEHDKVDFLYRILKQHEKTEKISLLSFYWIILPDERISINIVTDRAVKDFNYRY